MRRSVDDFEVANPSALKARSSTCPGHAILYSLTQPSHTHTIHPSICCLSSEYTNRCRRCRPIWLGSLRCWSSGTETLVVVQSLLPERPLTVHAWDGLGDGMPLPQMVGQPCLVDSLKGATRVTATQRLLIDSKPLLTALLPSVLHTLLLLFLLPVQVLCTALDGSAPGVAIHGLLSPVPRQVAALEVSNYNIIPPAFLPTRRPFATNGGRDEKLLR